MEKVKIGWSSCEAVKRSGQVVALVQVKLQNWLQSLKLFDCGAREGNYNLESHSEHLLWMASGKSCYLLFEARWLAQGWCRKGARGYKAQINGQMACAPGHKCISAFVQRLVWGGCALHTVAFVRLKVCLLLTPTQLFLFFNLSTSAMLFPKSKPHFRLVLNVVLFRFWGIGQLQRRRYSCLDCWARAIYLRFPFL